MLLCQIEGLYTKKPVFDFILRAPESKKACSDNEF